MLSQDRDCWGSCRCWQSQFPRRKLLLLMDTEHQVEVHWLKNLNISPTQCYQQVYDHAGEFLPHALPSESSEQPY